MDRICVDLEAWGALIYRLREMTEEIEILCARLRCLRYSLNDKNVVEDNMSFELYCQARRMEEQIERSAWLIQRIRFACEIWAACEEENAALTEQLSAGAALECTAGEQERFTAPQMAVNK